MLAGMECFGTGDLNDDLRLARDGVATEDPIALISIRVGRRLLCATMRGEVEKAVGSQIDSAMNFGGPINSFRQLESFRRRTKRAQRLGGCIIFVDEPGAVAVRTVPLRADGQVIADRRIVLPGRCEAVSPVRPRLSRIGLPRVVNEVDARRDLGDRYALAQFGRRLQKSRRLVTCHFLSVGKFRREWRFERLRPGNALFRLRILRRRFLGRLIPLRRLGEVVGIKYDTLIGGHALAAQRSLSMR
ncbi:MAG: hypothetical protein QM775_12560 [Pirellulales bacterium]